MADLAGQFAILAIAGLLALGLTRQFAVSGPRWLLLDRIALVPQWKFFGQVTIAAGDEAFADHHLLIRIASPHGEPGAWREVLWHGERRAIEALWNPAARGRNGIFLRLAMLEASAARGSEPIPPTALTYLTLLRHCFERHPPGPGEALQFAVATTCGRSARNLELRFLSQWHIP